MELEIDIKKIMGIMYKLFYIVLMLMTTLSFAQEKSKKKLSEKDFQKQVSYERKDSYKGPKPSMYSSPAPMYESMDGEGGEETQTKRPGGIQFDENQLDKMREKKGSSSTNETEGNGGTIIKDPSIREFEEPEYEEPEDNELEVKPFNLSSGVVTSILIILGALLLILIIYLFVRNRANRNKRIQTTFVQEEWNPTQITKSELELKLEEAFLREDYRTCVRIYFTFILKELIKSGKISWKKEYTNYDYLNQLSSDADYEVFLKIVNIYDLVWYGEFSLSKTEYLEVQPLLEGYYKQIETNHE